MKSAKPILNDTVSPSADPLPSPAIAAQLKHAVNRFQGYIGWHVEYEAIARSAAFLDYQRVAAQLHRFDLSHFTSMAEQMAFWINLYNALMVHAVIYYQIRHSVRELRGIFDRAAYQVSRHRLSLNDIEHGILRANSRSPLGLRRHFRPHDPRRAWSLPRLDPRLHFTLVCAARGCPPIGLYDAERLDQQLEIATASFVRSGGVEVDRARRQVSLSRLFAWYAEDFGSTPYGLGNNQPTLRFIAQRLPDDDAQFIREYSARLKIRFTPYDWTLND